MGLLMFLRRKFHPRRTAAATPPDEKSAVCSSDGKIRLSWEEIRRLTVDFSRIIGYGGFSTVYLVQFRRSSMAAVKIYCSSPRLHQAYRQELEILPRLHHRNIVKLLGHCDDRDDEGVLILEYIPNGNLQEKLLESNSILPWRQRMAIAFQLAQAIAYLHEECSPQIVHGDIKASNVLLDRNLNCKLCDFGSAKMGFSSTVLPGPDRKQRMMMGSPGYTDPLYLKTGLVSKKNDIYSFGVIVLELITGMEAFSPKSGERLAVRAAPMLREAEKVEEMVDPRLRGEVGLGEARAMAALSAKCLCECPSLRPSASDIVATMRCTISSLSSIY